MSKVTPLASRAITAVDILTIELIETDQEPAVVIVSWPLKATVLIRTAFRLPRRLPPAPSPPQW
jgi:hypothetical protein